MSASILQAVTSRNLLVGVLALGSFVALSNAADVTGPSKPVTFAKDIAPIFHEKCDACHRNGSMAPDVARHLRRNSPLILGLAAGTIVELSLSAFLCFIVRDPESAERFIQLARLQEPCS